MGCSRQEEQSGQGPGREDEPSSCRERLEERGSLGRKRMTDTTKSLERQAGRPRPARGQQGTVVMGALPASFITAFSGATDPLYRRGLRSRGIREADPERLPRWCS